jgi:head-tail adaptor
MTIGRKNKRISFQVPERTQELWAETELVGDSRGLDLWPNIANAWASIEPVRGRQLKTADQIKAQVSHRIWTKWTQTLADMTGRARIFLRGLERPDPQIIVEGVGGSTQSSQASAVHTVQPIFKPVRHEQKDYVGVLADTIVSTIPGDTHFRIRRKVVFGNVYHNGLVTELNNTAPIIPPNQFPRGWYKLPFTIWTYRYPDRYFDIHSVRAIAKKEIEFMVVENLTDALPARRQKQFEDQREDWV